MSNSRFGKLIGVLDVTNSFCRFLVSVIVRSRLNSLCLIFLMNSIKVYAVKNREILTCHEISISKIEGSDEDEYDPIELWNAVQEVIIDFSQKFIRSLHEVIDLFQGDAHSHRESHDS